LNRPPEAVCLSHRIFHCRSTWWLTSFIQFLPKMIS
jgi:hypothetical protein